MPKITPQKTSNSVRGQIAENILAGKLASFCLPHKVERENDVGIDFICELLTNLEPTGELFLVQCKALPRDETGKKKTNVDNSISISGVKLTTITYWEKLGIPIILFIVDEIDNKFYWKLLNPSEILTNCTSDETTTIKCSQKEFNLHDILAHPGF